MDCPAALDWQALSAIESIAFAAGFLIWDGPASRSRQLFACRRPLQRWWPGRARAANAAVAASAISSVP